MKRETLFWDVDTQYDLMRPEGRLCVPGAEGIIDNVNKARRFAIDNGYSILASTDWHQDWNPEISNKPDFQSTFPPHCIADTPGSKRVGYLGNLPIGIVPNKPMSDTDLCELLDKKQFHVEIRKEEFDVFSNPNTLKLLEILKPRFVVVFGLAIDLCVKQAMERLIKTRGIHSYLLRDAVKTLGLNADKKVVEELKNMGVEVISVSDLNKKF